MTDDARGMVEVEPVPVSGGRATVTMSDSAPIDTDPDAPSANALMAIRNTATATIK